MYCCIHRHACHFSLAAEYRRVSLLLPMKYLTLLFQLLVHWVLWKPLQRLPFQESKMEGFFLYLTQLFRWRENMKMICTPIQWIVHGRRNTAWILSHPLSTQLQHSEAFHRWPRLFSGFSSYWGYQDASDLVCFSVVVLFACVFSFLFFSFSRN